MVMDGSIHSRMSGAFSPSCARIQTQYRPCGGTSLLRMFVNFFIVPSIEYTGVLSRWQTPGPDHVFKRRKKPRSFRGIPLARRFSMRASGKSFQAGCAMLAQRGGPGGVDNPEVPVLALEFPCVLFSFRAIVMRLDLGYHTPIG